MVSVLCYHKNLSQLYPTEWIEEYKHSILCQSFQKFQIMEMNYGGGHERIFENSYFESYAMPTFVHALNYLLDKCFSSGYSCVFNSNVDDAYSFDWIQKQLEYNKEGYDIVASNFSLKYEPPMVRPQKNHYFDRLNIKKELEKGHNPVGHPGVCYSKRFWENNVYVPEEMPKEDMMLWQRSVDDFKFIILPDFLFIHRIHDNAVCRSQNK